MKVLVGYFDSGKGDSSKVVAQKLYRSSERHAFVSHLALVHCATTAAGYWMKMMAFKDFAAAERELEDFIVWQTHANAWGGACLPAIAS